VITGLKLVDGSAQDRNGAGFLAVEWPNAAALQVQNLTHSRTDEVGDHDETGGIEWSCPGFVDSFSSSSSSFCASILPAAQSARRQAAEAPRGFF
jgi:hypothetical protein